MSKEWRTGITEMKQDDAAVKRLMCRVVMILKYPNNYNYKQKERAFFRLRDIKLKYDRGEMGYYKNPQNQTNVYYWFNEFQKRFGF